MHNVEDTRIIKIGSNPKNFNLITLSITPQTPKIRIKRRYENKVAQARTMPNAPPYHCIGQRNLNLLCCRSSLYKQIRLRMNALASM